MRYLLICAILINALQAIADEPRVRTLVGFGDSITKKLDGTSSWLGFVSDYHVIVTQGHSGAKSSDGQTDVTKFLATNETIDTAVLMYGTNHGGGMTVAEVVEDLLSMASELTAAGVKVVIASPPPFTTNSDDCNLTPTADMVQFVADLASALVTATAAADIAYANVWAAWEAYDAHASKDKDDLFTDTVGPGPTCSAGANGVPDDGVHPNVAGDLLIADTIRPLLEDVDPPPSHGCKN